MRRPSWKMSVPDAESSILKPCVAPRAVNCSMFPHRFSDKRQARWGYRRVQDWLQRSIDSSFCRVASSAGLRTLHCPPISPLRKLRSLRAQALRPWLQMKTLWSASYMTVFIDKSTLGTDTKSPPARKMPTWLLKYRCRTSRTCRICGSTSERSKQTSFSGLSMNVSLAQSRKDLPTQR
jgi:hypothetical protein